MDRDLLYHVQDIEFTNALTTREAVLRVRARRDDVSACWLHLGGGPQTVPMERRSGTDRHDFFEARVSLPPEGIMYCFTVRNGGGDVQWFTKYGLYEDGVYEKNTHHGLWTLAVSERDVFTTPQWVRDAVFYQIFPERFRNGDPSNDPPGSVPWDAKPELANFYGGDLQGVLDKLPYLQDLGVNAIYFNPIFAASTNHKYNTSDYYKVEPSFGDTALLKKLVAACHERGMRVVLDGVFNHVGVDFAPFQDVLKNGRDSKYKDWFFIHSYPVKMHPKPTYACWWNIWELPKLNTENPEVRAYLLDVATHWIRETDIDGWRLDVPEEVPHAFWIDFRKTVKAVRPDAYIVGEIWHDGRPWLRGDQFDAVMNYPLREAILALLGATTREGSKAGVKKQDVAAYHTAVQQLLTDLPQQVVEVQFNLLGSHDTERMLTLFKGDARKVRMAAALLMTAPGAPVIYYGDEVGMKGGRDPDCRRGFPWDGPQDRATFDWFKRLIALRHEFAALRTGRYDAALVDKNSNVYGFRRTDGSSSLLVLVNPNDKAVDTEVSLSESPAAHTRDLVGDASIAVDGTKLRCRLQPFQTVITRLK